MKLKQIFELVAFPEAQWTNGVRLGVLGLHDHALFDVEHGVVRVFVDLLLFGEVFVNCARDTPIGRKPLVVSLLKPHRRQCQAVF